MSPSWIVWDAIQDYGAQESQKKDATEDNPWHFCKFAMLTNIIMAYIMENTAQEYCESDI